MQGGWKKGNGAVAMTHGNTGRPAPRCGPRTFTAPAGQARENTSGTEHRPYGQRAGRRRAGGAQHDIVALAPYSLPHRTEGPSRMIIDRETFTELAVHLKLASDAVLSTAKHLAVLSNGQTV